MTPGIFKILEKIFSLTLAKISSSLFLRLLISYLFLATVPIILLGTILIHTTRTTIERNILDRNLELAKKSAEIIEGTLDRARDILRLNAQNPAIYRTDDRLSQELVINSIVSEFNLFRKVSLIDTAGNLVTSTSYSGIQSTQEKEFNQSLIRGGAVHSTVFVAEDQLPYLLIAQRIIFQNELVGWIVGEVRLQAMWELVDRSIKSDKSQAFIFDSQGKFLAHTDRRLVFLNEKFTEQEIIDDVVLSRTELPEQLPSTQPISYDKNQLSTDKNLMQTFGRYAEPAPEQKLVGGPKIYNDHSGVKMIAAYTGFRTRKWGFVIQQPASEAFLPARRMQIQILIFVLAAILVGSLFAYVYAMHLVRPISVLVQGIEKFSQGDLKYRIKTLGKDEIGKLSDKFNEMANKIYSIQRQLRRTERLATLSRMAAILSHEIRNPLNSMVINMQILKREFDKYLDGNQTKLNKFYQIIISEITRIDDLVKNFLIISKSSRLNRKPEILDEIITEIAGSQEANAQSLNIRIKLSFLHHQVIANVDRERMHQVFLNLFLNAFDAMPNGGALVVRLEKLAPKTSSNGTKPDLVKISIIDNGCGISEEHLENIFDFYYSTKPHGTGIGLALAQQIIEDHGGTIKVKSQIGKGTCIRVYLPI